MIRECRPPSPPISPCCCLQRAPHPYCPDRTAPDFSAVCPLPTGTGAVPLLPVCCSSVLSATHYLQAALGGKSLLGGFHQQCTQVPSCGNGDSAAWKSATQGFLIAPHWASWQGATCLPSLSSPWREGKTAEHYGIVRVFRHDHMLYLFWKDKEVAV